MAFVLDASVTMGWCFTDEANPYSQSVLKELLRSYAVVPALWLLEVRNVLLTNERRKRISQAATDKFLDLLGRLNIQVQEEQPACTPERC